MPLTNTEYYEKNKLWYDVERNAYWPISPFHDGNCGLHAFACGLIDMMITGKLSLNAEKFNAFKNTISASLMENFNDKHPYIEVLSNLLILDILCKPDLTFNVFKCFLQIQTRKSLAATNLILVPGLRVIGVTQYLSLINKQDDALLEEDHKLLKDGEWVGDEVLSSLANYFGIPIRLILDRSSDDRPSDCYYHLPEKDLPAFSLLNQNSHWHYLLPEKQRNGLARILPQRKKSQTSLQSNERLQTNEQILQDIEKNYIKTTPIFSKETLSSLSEKLKQIFCHLKIIFSTLSIGNSNRDALNTLRQANIAAEKSTTVLNTLRQTWDYDTNELDRRLNKLGLRKIEKDLIKEPIITDNSKDAAMAAVLQNAEIADFFSRNYTTLTSSNGAATPTLQSPNKTNNTKLLSRL